MLKQKQLPNCLEEKEVHRGFETQLITCCNLLVR